MKKLFLFSIVMLLSFGVTFSQNNKKEKKSSKAGSFLEKAEKKVKKTEKKVANLADLDKVSITMENKKLNDKVSFEFVGCYGDSQSGDVYMVIKGKIKIDKSKMFVTQQLGVTSKGKIYNIGDNFNSGEFQVVKGVAVEMNLEKTPLKNVPSSVKQLEDVKCRVQIDGDTDSYHFHNVPILWDQKPEE